MGLVESEWEIISHIVREPLCSGLYRGTDFMHKNHNAVGSKMSIIM